jgi:hypothetical protein
MVSAISKSHSSIARTRGMADLPEMSQVAETSRRDLQRRQAAAQDAADALGHYRRLWHWELRSRWVVGTLGRFAIVA